MIEFEQLCVRLGRRDLLQDLSFSVADGACIGLVGENGAGKSTLLKAIAGLLPIQGGTVRLDGRVLSPKERAARGVVGFIPQDNPLFADATALDHLRLAYSGTGKSLEAALSDGLPARLGIADFLQKPVGALSGGMKKRLSIACALSDNPRLVLMDEPAAALDMAGRAQMREIIEGLRTEGKSIILATHEEADFVLCSGFMLLAGGTGRTFDAGQSGRVLAILQGGEPV